VERNDHRLGWRKVLKQSREINEVLDLMNIDNIGLGYFRANVSQQVSTRISQPAHDSSTGLTGPLFLKLYPSSAKNPRSTAKENAIARINCRISIV